MKYKIVAVGKIKQAYLRDAIADYRQRLRPYGGVQICEVPEAKFPVKPVAAELARGLATEGAALLRQIKPDEYLFLLDLHGKQCSSEDFAETLRQLGLQGYSEVTFAIGGAFGVGENIRHRAQARLSLGKWTYTHQMVRYLLCEQVYRAEKINRNEPYHW